MSLSKISAKMPYTHKTRALCQNTYPDPVCRDNYTLHQYDPPLLYDLHTDPSEIYNLDVTEYKEVMDKINEVLHSISTLHTDNSYWSIVFQLKEKFEVNMVWGESQINRGTNTKVEPCAKADCTPFPSCCKSMPSKLNLDLTSRVIT